MHPDLTEEVQLGTTICAIKCQDGIIVASDSRTSAGSLISNDFSDKIGKITEHIVILRCGSAASSQLLISIADTEALLYKRTTGKEIPVIGLATRINSILRRYPEILKSAFIVVGYDEIKGHQVYLLTNGMMQPINVAALGSGSTFIIENLFTHFSENTRTVEQSLDFVKSQILMAINGDNSSGGVVNVSVVKASGITKLPDWNSAIRLDNSKASIIDV
ncbi:MAG: Proteasome subunit beta type-6 [Paramarteilia canceri]